MTSSLVGSEMCIRDRYTHPLGCPTQVEVGCSYGNPQGHWPTSNSGCTDCLLYTSDAADDM
eukprot:2887536-Prorocentrum_lima.AAC.1